MDTTFDWDVVYNEIFLTPEHAIAVVISAIAIYVVFLTYIRILGQRTLAGLSTFDALITIMIGAIAGRVILGFQPTLMSGVLGLLVLFLMEGIFGTLRSYHRGNLILNVPPVLIMAGNQPLASAMRRSRITVGELNTVLRQSGIGTYDDVAAVIMEPGGRLSVIKRGTPIDPAILVGVRGVEHLPPELLK